MVVRTGGKGKPPRRFAGVVVAMAGLPARGKTQVAHCLARRLNWNGESAKGWLKSMRDPRFNAPLKIVRPRLGSAGLFSRVYKLHILIIAQFRVSNTI